MSCNDQPHGNQQQGEDRAERLIELERQRQRDDGVEAKDDVSGPQSVPGDDPTAKRLDEFMIVADRDESGTGSGQTGQRVRPVPAIRTC